VDPKPDRRQRKKLNLNDIACPLCRSEDVQVVTNIPAIAVYKCRACATAFIIAPPAPHGVS